jgi:hypothetical protein
MYKPLKPVFLAPDGSRLTKHAERIDEPDEDPDVITYGTTLELTDTPLQAGESYRARADDEGLVGVEVSLDEGDTWEDAIAAEVPSGGTVGVEHPLHVRTSCGPIPDDELRTVNASLWVEGVPLAAPWRE